MRFAATIAALLCLSGAARAVPNFYPVDYAALVAAAERERDLNVYGALDAGAVQPLLQAFAKAYPRIALNYVDLGAGELDARLRSESAAGRTGDVAWSGAMQLQMKLVRDGFATRYGSPEKSHLPPSAQSDDAAYVVTYEPAVFVHDRHNLPDAPTTHAAFLRMLTERRTMLTGKVATYDVARNGLALTFLRSDAAQFADFPALTQALHDVDARRHATSGTILSQIGSGRLLLAYDVAASEALTRAAKDPNLGVVYPQDFTVLAPTVMLLPRAQQHPNAARLFLDFALSRDGQQALASGQLVAARSEVAGDATLAALAARLGGRAKPVPLDHSDVQDRDTSLLSGLLQAWQDTTTSH